MNNMDGNYPPVPSDAKWTFTTRRVHRSDVAGTSTRFASAVSGDVVLAKVIKVGHHKRTQLAEGRASESYIGDHVVLTCGDRYAPDQFEGIAELDAQGADLLAGGGVLGRMLQANTRMSAPTRLMPIGLLTDKAGEIINIERYALPARKPNRPIVVFAVVGASMNSGKTTAVASLAHGLRRAGLCVATIKVTGTGAFGDFNAYRDAGASVVADFTDAGMASTYRQPIKRIEQACESLLAHSVEQGADVAVVELADGVFQQETAALLRGSGVRASFSGVLFAAPDALGACGGVACLRKLGIEPIAVTGMVSCSPLAVAEAESATNTRVLSRETLQDPEMVTKLLGELIQSSSQPAHDAPATFKAVA